MEVDNSQGNDEEGSQVQDEPMQQDGGNTGDGGSTPARPSDGSRRTLTLMVNKTPSEKCSCISSLLQEISGLRRKASDADEMASSFVFVSPKDEEKWCTLFAEYVLENFYCSNEKCTAHSDDMLWYVPHGRMVSAPPSVYTEQGLPASLQTSHLQVFRRQSKNKPVPSLDKNINWEESVCLNVVLQQLDYYVTCAVCTKSQSNLQILSKNCQRVFPSPSRRRMDVKGECEEITYPKIYFAIDNFDRVFDDVVVNEGECVCVELVARDRYRDREAVVFLGSIRYDVLRKIYDARGGGTWNWAQKLMSSAKRRHEFVKMRGPKGKGFAEMAVAKVASCGFETPMSESGFSFRDEELDITGQSRRMSEANLFNRFWYGNSNRSSGGGNRTAITPNPSCYTPDRDPLGRGRRTPNAREDGFDTQSAYGAEETPTSGNSMWSVKGIGQALQFLRDKPEQSQPLNAYLTYITLTWKSILDDVLVPEGRGRKPILTGDLDYLQHS